MWKLVSKMCTDCVRPFCSRSLQLPVPFSLRRCPCSGTERPWTRRVQLPVPVFSFVGNLDPGQLGTAAAPASCRQDLCPGAPVLGTAGASVLRAWDTVLRWVRHFCDTMWVCLCADANMQGSAFLPEALEMKLKNELPVQCHC